MPGAKHISEGKCALYGKVQHDDYTAMQMWRHRLHNEHSGIPRADQTGTNTTVSMLWNPSPRGAGRSSYAMTSQKRPSELKRVQDFGAYNGYNARFTLGEGSLSARGGGALPPSSSAAPRPPPSIAAAPSGAAGAADGPPGEGFLDSEASRLQAAAHARNLGQTFLLAGNLRQAKAYLARAEQLLSVDEKFYDGPAAKKALDELKRFTS